MSMIRFSALALTLALAAAPALALAQEFKAGDITIDKAWARATPKAPTSAPVTSSSATMARLRTV